jgi:hypothetical protein
MPEFCAVITPCTSDDFLRGYMEAIEWLLDDETRDNAENFAPATERACAKDCEEFQKAAGDLLASIDAHQAGVDLWLTRNRHGAGFWDRGHGAIGDKLTALAHAMGGLESYVGDDGLVYLGGREND